MLNGDLPWLGTSTRSGVKVDIEAALRGLKIACCPSLGTSANVYVPRCFEQLVTTRSCGCSRARGV